LLSSRFDIIGFDACMMGAYEVATGIAPYAHYMIASEENEPNDGWDYTAFDHLAENDQATSITLGREILARFVRTSSPGDPKVTLSMFDLTRVDELVTALEDLNAELVPNMAQYAAFIGRQLNRTQSFASNPNPEEDWFMFDLGELLTRLSHHESAMGPLAAEAREALDAIVVGNRTGRTHEGASGMSVHFPPYPEYYGSDWYTSFGVPAWTDLLDAYYSAGQNIPDSQHPSFEPVGNQAVTYIDANGLNAEAEFNESALENIVESVLYSGVIEDDGTVTFFGQDQGWVDGTFAYATYDLTVLTLDDGVDQAVAFQAISFNEEITFFTLDVPLAYYPPGMPVGTDDYFDILLSLTYDLETEQFTETFFIYDEFGTMGEFDADPEGLLVPWLLQMDPDGTVSWVQTSDVGLWADLPNLLYQFDDLPPGTPLYAELIVYDYGGNSDFASGEVALTTTGQAGVAQCRNDYWSFQFEYPASWYVWNPADPALACAYLDYSPFEGTTDADAFAQAGLVVEVYERADLDAWFDFLDEEAPYVETVTVAGIESVLAYSEPGEFGVYTYTIPIFPGDTYSPTLVISGWDVVNDDLAARVDALAASLVFAG